MHSISGPHHGHYISIIKTTGSWFVFDDDNVSKIPESDIPRYFGDSNSGSAYILYYQAVDIDLLNLGLRPPTAEANTTYVPDKPQIPAQHSPALPPGLESISSSNLHPFPHHHPPENPSSTTPGLAVPQSSDLTPRQVSQAPGPMSPTSLGRQIMNTIRRAPSMSATRTSASTGLNGTDRKSLSEKSPRLSASFAAFTDSFHEVPPPVPPLPPSILASPPPPSPSTLTASVNEPQKEEKGKDREKSSWFSKKRKSLRSSDKGGKHESVLAQIPPSPFIVTEDSHSQSQHTGWFNKSNSSTAPKYQWASRTATSSDVLEPHVPSSRRGSSTHEHRLNGLEDSLQPSGSSSPSSTSLPMGGTTQPSPSISTSSVAPDFPYPSRNSPLPTSRSLERSRSSLDRKKSSRNSNSPHHTIPSSSNTSDQHPLPPLPPSYLDPHRAMPSNGHLPESETVTPLDKALAAQGKGLRHPVSNTALPSLSRSSALPSASLNLPVDTQENNSLDNLHNSRSPNRKLSLTAPILAFGRKDREREKR